MKINRFMLFSGLILTFGSIFGLPAVGALASALFGDEIDKILIANADSAPIILVGAIGVAVVIPIADRS